MADLNILLRITDGLLKAPSTHSRASLGLVLAGLCFFLPGFWTIGPLDRDEPRFAQASRQMIETGDYVAIRFQDEARNKKPVGIYWMQAGVVHIAEALGVPQAEHKIWLYRLPSLLGAIASVLLTYWAALAFLSIEGAWLAALLFGATILIGVESRLAKTDAFVCATVIAAMGALARVYMRAGKDVLLRWAGVFWLAMGVGLLVKGPITPLAPALAALTLSIRIRSGRWLAGLRPLRGLLLCLAIAAPWFVLIMIQTKGAFLADSVGADMLSKVASGQEAHGAPPGTYLLVFFATAWPLAALAALAVPFAWKNRTDPAVAFLAAWIVPTWLLFEIVPTKLPHYVLPLYPALAILVALAFERKGMLADRVWKRALLWIVPAIAVVLVVTGLVGAVVLRAWPGPMFFIALPFVCWQIWRVGRAILRQDLKAVAVGGVLLAVLSYPMVFVGIMSGPVFAPLRMSPRLAQAIEQVQAEHPACPQMPMMSAGYSEPSLVLLTRTDLRFGLGAEAGAFLAQSDCRLALVDARQEEAFRAALGAKADVVLASRVQGININGGRRLDIAIFVRQDRKP